MQFTFGKLDQYCQFLFKDTGRRIVFNLKENSIIWIQMIKAQVQNASQDAPEAMYHLPVFDKLTSSLA